MAEDQPHCGHEECRRNHDDEFLLAESLGFKEITPGAMVFRTEDPEEVINVIRHMVRGIDGAAKDIVIQSEELARRAALQRVKGGRVEMRKVGIRAFWEGVKKCLTFRRRKTR